MAEWAYCTVEDVKALEGTNTSLADSLIAELVERATDLVEAYTGRKFYEKPGVRYYTPYEDTDTDGILYLDEDLIRVVTLTNGDDEEIPAVGYKLLPLNSSPKWFIKLVSPYYWTYDDDPTGAIAVDGDWGYCTIADRLKHHTDLTQATARLALWMHRQKSAPFEKTGNTMTGQYSVPVAFPDDVAEVLERYRLRPFGGA